MLLFWLLTALLVVATLCTLVWPLLRRTSRPDAPDPRGAAIAVFRDHKRTLDAEYDSGAITAAERDAALAELTRRVADEGVEAPSPAVAHHSRVAWPVAIALIVVIPIAAIMLYQRLGNPAATAVADVATGHDVSERQIVAMVESLAQRLKEHPDDGEGWVLLARSYQALGRFAEAADAYAHADALIKDDPNLLADYADVLAMAQGRRLAGKPAALIERALAIDPRQRKALALAATVALEARDFAASLGYWRRLAAELPAGSDEARQVAEVIAEMETVQRQGKGSTSASRGKQAQRAGDAVAAAAPPAASARPVAGAISGRVDLMSALASRVALTDTVFIYARAPEGSRMPLAVLRIPARELPKDFVLDDSMGMAPGVKLSTAPAVIVEARISKSGNAIAQPGDLFGKSSPVKPGTAGLRISIDQVVP
jgi:cytochrome c-type biogenesis protein CcmH